MRKAAARRLTTIHPARAVAAAIALLFAGAPDPSASTKQVGQYSVVSTRAGLVRGQIGSSGVVTFKGVPFARPPVDGRRWKPPEPSLHWKGIREATSFSAACMQPLGGPSGFYTDNPSRMDEDCLYLNVWAPVGARKAPVMVYLHGGALITGSGMNRRYDGTRLSRLGVIVVTINYRLGVFGYFAHPELSAESAHHASGNYGTLDQIAALRWIRQNIAAFGGDPGRVTIFGQSAGALSVTQLMASPLAANLFQRAIAQSPYLPPMPYLRKAGFGIPAAEATGATFGKVLGKPSIALLRAMPASALQEASEKIYSHNEYGMPLATTAVVDGWVQRAQVFETFEQGREAKVPFMAGFASGELRSFDPATLPSFAGSTADFEQRVRGAYGRLAGQFLEHYPAKHLRDSSYDAWRDAYYGWATERLLRLHHLTTNASWMYYFDHVYPSSDARGVGAFHSSDVPFVFGNVGAAAIAPKNWPTPPNRLIDEGMSQTMMAYWVAFARTGMPKPSGHPAWPRFDPTGQSYMAFHNGEAVPSSRLLSGRYMLHDAYIGRLRAREDTTWNWSRTGVVAAQAP